MRLLVVGVTALGLIASPARADDGVVSRPSASSPSPPDVVRLKSGGMMRGTIVELVPHDSVTVQLADGRTRKVALSDTTYAGSAATEARGVATLEGDDATAYAVIHSERAKVSLEGQQAGLTFHVQTATAGIRHSNLTAEGFSRLCTAPCAVELPAGTHRFALSRPDGDLASADNDIEVRGSQTLRGGIVDRHGLRVAGVLLLSIGTPIGAGALVLGAVLLGNPQSQAPMPLFVGGTAVVLGSVIVGPILVTRSDYATLELSPGVALLVAPHAAPRLETGFTPSGATVALRF